MVKEILTFCVICIMLFVFIFSKNLTFTVTLIISVSVLILTGWVFPQKPEPLEESAVETAKAEPVDNDDDCFEVHWRRIEAELAPKKPGSSTELSESEAVIKCMLLSIVILKIMNYRIYSCISREILGKIICNSLGGRLIPRARNQTKKHSAWACPKRV